MTHALVLGASGLVGGHVVQGLVARGCAVRCAGRRPREGWVRFDLTDPATFGPALAGVDRVFLVARPGDDAPQVVAAPLIEAMARAGVAHVVNLSAMGAELRPEFGLRKVELLLEASGMAFTHLRPNWFMQVFTVPPLGPLLAATGTLALPAGDASTWSGLFGYSVRTLPSAIRAKRDARAAVSTGACVGGQRRHLPAPLFFRPTRRRPRGSRACARAP